MTAKAQGWTPIVVDSNGNGRRDAYVEPDQPADPTKDRRIQGGSYGVIPNPVDGSIWTAAPGVPGAIIRVMPGPDPTKTALAEIYEPPFNNPRSKVNAYPFRAASTSIATVSSGRRCGQLHLASFDRRKCKVLNGPTATGQHCPEGWSLYLTPGPNFKGVTDESNADMLYYNWVDQFDTLGLGRNTPIATGSYSDALWLSPAGNSSSCECRIRWGFITAAWKVASTIQRPDGRVAGCGRTTEATIHGTTKAEKGTTSKAVHFQVRPDPLAK